MSEQLYIDTLDRICVNGVCHCDWRLTLRDCVESKAMTIVHGINVGLSGITFIVGTVLLFHRVFIKGHGFFDRNPAKGFLRPKPIDCMLLFIVIFNALRLLSSVVLITDICKGMISRSFLFEFPWQFGFASFGLYLIGIIQTLADSHSVIGSSWVPSVGIIGGAILLTPVIVNNAISLAAGIMQTKNNMSVAILLTRLLYCIWFYHLVSLSLAVTTAGIRLTRILRSHLEKFDKSGPRYVSLRTGLFKIRTIMTLTLMCLLGFAIFLLCWGILRKYIMVNFYGSIVLGIIWNSWGALCTFGVEIAVIINPKINEQPAADLGLKSSSVEKSVSEAPPLATFTNFSTQEYSVNSGGNNGGGHDTTSLSPLKELKLQQLQYQKVFQQHQSSHNANNRRQSNMIDLPAEAAGTKQAFDNDTRHHHIGDEQMMDDDGENSQLDLVEYASKD